MRLNNPAMAGTDDLRDLWNQQTPFAIAEGAAAAVPEAPEGQLRRTGTCATARRTGRRRRSPPTPMCFSTIFCCSTSPSRSPTRATSRSRRARSTGVPTRPGGGRTVDANVIDILLTWLVNRDREFLQGGATGATKPGMKVFPVFRDAEHRTADRRRIRRPCGAARQGVVADRTVRRHLASAGREHST